eukprot:g2692.t1
MRKLFWAPGQRNQEAAESKGAFAEVAGSQGSFADAATRPKKKKAKSLKKNRLSNPCDDLSKLGEWEKGERPQQLLQAKSRPVLPAGHVFLRLPWQNVRSAGADRLRNQESAETKAVDETTEDDEEFEGSLAEADACLGQQVEGNDVMACNAFQERPQQLLPEESWPVLR